MSRSHIALLSVLRTRLLIETLILQLTLNGNIMKQINEVKHLGLYIDENLTWKSHCDFLSKKISQKLGLFKRLRTFLPLHVISNLYFPLIQSLIDYGITLWGNCAKSYLSLIQKLQNRTARIITQKHKAIQNIPVLT